MLISGEIEMVLAVTGITGHSGSFMLQQLIDNKFEGTLRCMVRETSTTKKLDESVGTAVADEEDDE